MLRSRQDWTRRNARARRPSGQTVSRHAGDVRSPAPGPGGGRPRIDPSPIRRQTAGATPLSRLKGSLNDRLAEEDGTYAISPSDGSVTANGSRANREVRQPPGDRRPAKSKDGPGDDLMGCKAARPLLDRNAPLAPEHKRPSQLSPSDAFPTGDDHACDLKLASRKERAFAHGVAKDSNRTPSGHC